jgi:hypothetical protein
MYEEDRFNPAYYKENIDGDLDDNIKTSKVIENIDSNFVKIKKEVPNPNYNQKVRGSKPNKMVTIELYGSGCMGNHIRSAVNGFRTSHIVGTQDENFYFTVVDSIGHRGRKEPLFLFFDSPEQYEKHCYVTLPHNLKNAWHEKVGQYRSQ